MADYDWFDSSPTAAETTAAYWRPQGLVAQFESLSGNRIKYYICRRGCGTLVHDPEVHVKNVCRAWEPTVG